MSAPTLMVGGTLPGSDRDVWTGGVGSPQWASRPALGAHQRALGALIAVIGSRDMTAGIEPARGHGQGSTRRASGVISGCSCGSAGGTIWSSARAVAMFSARLALAKSP